ncbi:hypothetical protein PO124_16085 [Bacillus licheniformis]|nr:hypothetical protein [Bacillus licheniformis]
MTTGMPIVVRGVMKPIPTLYKPLKALISRQRAVYSEHRAFRLLRCPCRKRGG